jgi:Protein of unknown function (DUF1553)/Protein of unknown function (DUF1549)/Planctomycete cytochrome C
MRTALLVVSFVISAALGASEADEAAFFESQVRPILSERCLECHSSGKKTKGGLSLDSRADWLKGGDSGPAITPGKPETSLLLTAVSWRDLDLQMPPKKKLSEREVQVLTDWVRRGAYDPREAGTTTAAHKSRALSIADGRNFWAYAPFKPAVVPAVRDATWPRTDIDRYVLAGMEAHDLQPVTDAAPAALVRRLVFVLTGLPPTAEQIERFVAKATANRAQAIDELTTELLASPAFAERFASHWLDITRFAESSGGGRTLLFKDAWRFRDYVVQAFAENRPLDQLIREHLAGDLLPAATPQERSRNLIATGFLALGPTIYEEQDKQRLRFDVIDEQLDTIGKAFLGQTIGCARCHDHKFDPILQRDYYALAGIFASTRTLSNYTDNVVRWIDVPLPLAPAEEKRIAEAETQFEAAQKRLKAAKNELAKLKDVASGLSKKTDQPLPFSELAGVAIDDSQAKASGAWKKSTHSPHFFGVGYLHDDGKDKGAKSLAFTPRLSASGRYEVRFAYPALAGRSTHVPVHIFHAMGDVTVFVDETKEPDIEGRFVSLGTFQFEQDGDSYVIVSNEGTTGIVTADLVQFLPVGTASQSSVTASATTPATSNEPSAGSVLRAEITRLEQQLAQLSPIKDGRPLAMCVREEDTIADTAIRIRGEVHQQAAVVPRGFLSVLSQGTATLPATQSGRRELAEWLVSRSNPLPARVLVNRVWAWLFGQGLVRSVDNFGTTGETPSHPELLDFLAERFQREGWNVQMLVREIIRSRTWQLAVSSAPNDPDNRWLSHAARQRLDAEQLRDAMLVVSGALDRTVGGANIRGATSAASDSFAASAVEFGYQFSDVRRSLYTPAFRNNRLEIFALFDFSDNNSTQGQRHTSTVAPQALYFLNNPFVLDQARLAAKRLSTPSGNPNERLSQLFVACLGRPPLPAEAAACAQALQSGAAADEAWAMIVQSLFGSVAFRYLD